MTTVTGSQLHAARALAGLSRRELAAKAFVSDDTIGIWERSSDAAVSAKPALLDRTVAALEAAGVCFSPDGGVHPVKPPNLTATSEGVSP
jgi:transcriptional regulator with XRE-family HTH domain